MGVASLITRPDGTPITAPSNFCRFCSMIRCTPTGLSNCIASDESQGRPIKGGPNISCCLSAGILGGVVAVEIRGRHLGSWGIGQVRDENTPEKQIKEIVKASKQSSDLTRQLLGFARKQAIAPKILDLNQVVADLTKMLRRLIGESIDLEWRPLADLWPIKADTGQITQILTNLCANAHDGIQDVGKIIIETANTTLDKNYCITHETGIPGDYTCICVSDTGCGMTKETMDNIFEPFFTTKAEGKGTGLGAWGLGTVYGIVQQNKGAIEVDSELDIGSTFKIYLPRHMPRQETKRKTDCEKNKFLGNETILVVENDPGVLKIALTILKALGYCVLVANNPHEAITVCKDYTNAIDLLLTDVVMQT